MKNIRVLNFELAVIWTQIHPSFLTLLVVCVGTGFTLVESVKLECYLSRQKNGPMLLAYQIDVHHLCS